MGSSFGLHLLRLLLPLIALVPSGSANAAPQFTHARWTSADGVPGMISALAQTPDGYLWLATYEGLYRFDGVTFEHVQPAVGHPDGAIPATGLFVSRRGELWVGYAGRGGVEVYRRGRLVRVPMPQPPGEVTAFQEDAAGAIYAIGGRQPDTLSRFSGGRWQRVNGAAGLPPEFVSSMLLARDGVLWAATRNHLLFLRPGARKFEDTGERLMDGTGLAEDRAGNLWLSDPLGTRMVADYPRGRRKPLKSGSFPARSPVRRVTIMFDHEGALGGSTYIGGLFRIDSPGRDRAAEASVTHLRREDGLTSNQAVAIIEDREHNIWAATEIGLDRFRRADVEQARLPPRTSSRGFRMSVDRGGTIYVGNGDALYRAISGSDLEPFRSKVDATAICPDRRGGMWVALNGTIRLLSGERTSRTLRLPVANPVTGCGVDGDGRLWLTVPENGVFLSRGGGWGRVAVPDGYGRPRDVVVDAGGNPVVLLGNRAALQLKPSRPLLLTDDGVGVGGLTGVFPTDWGLLVAGGTGLARWDGAALKRISIRDQPWLRGVRGLVETKIGDTWLFSNKGIYRVPTRSLQEAFDHPRRRVPRIFLGEQDGLVSHTNAEEGPQALEAGGGRIWFLTRQGAVWVDPNELTTNPVPPTVIIRGLTAGGRHYTDPSGIRLDAGTRNLSIDYTALSLSAPNRVAFRYRLEGIDRDWIDPGTRRQAFYTNLRPGSYRFSVRAANDKGVWNQRAATLDFEIAPTFTQTWTFYALCAALVLGVLWLAYALRVRSISDRIRLRSAERLDERERIARELHDTLLQGIQALMLRFHVAAQAIEHGGTRRKLDAALDRAEETLVEARERLEDLRQFPTSEELEPIIVGAIGRQDFAAGVKVAVAIHGTPRPVGKELTSEIEAVVGEALINVQQHAGASVVTVEVTFDPERVIVSVRDDGRGITADILRAGRRSGHFGLPGMSERARRVGGTLEVRSVEGAGTEVRMSVPTQGHPGRRNWRTWGRAVDWMRPLATIGAALGIASAPKTHG
jgi:signal transduction histidine kinase/ligand-binding sensor domain-containing protein